ncbi:MAG: H-type lectin domain-containing protein [Oscillospiraceae bacterium]|nr:H-type lectin domain-containing protein [Oscillospiraceae bacterium]
MIQPETGDIRKAVFIINGVELEEEVVSITYTGELNGDDSSLRLGGAGSCWVKIKLKQTAQIWKGRRFSLKIADIPMGVFQVTEVTTTESETDLTAYDAMTYALERTVYQPESAATAFAVLAEIAAQAEVELGDLTGFSDTAVSGLPEGYTCREMAGYMAALLGGNAHMDRNGKLTVRWYQAADFTVDPDRFYQGELKAEDKDFELEGIKCTVTTQTTAAETDEEGNETQTQTAEITELTAGSDLAPLTLENPFMTQERLEAVYQTMGGWTYRPLSVTFLGEIGLEVGDQIAVTDTDGTVYTVPVMSITHSWDGGVKTTVKAVGISETESSESFGGSLTQQVQRLTADVAAFKNLSAQNLTATNARIKNLKTDVGEFGSIITDDLTAVKVNATKYITGVTIIGDLIQANTLSAKKIILEGADGLFYELNAKAGTLTAEQLSDEQYQQRLDGSVLVANSITADKINVTDLFAQDIVASGSISGLAIYATSGTIGGWNISQYALDQTGTRTVNGTVYNYKYVLQAPSDDNGWGSVLAITRETEEGAAKEYLAQLTYTGALSVQNVNVAGFAVPQIQHGAVSVTVTANTAASFSVTFPKAFSGVPDVVFTPRHNSNVTSLSYKLMSVTSSGFTGYVYSSNAGGHVIHWIAMY